MIICYDNQIINLDMGWRAIYLDTNFGDADWSVNTPTYAVTIELTDKSSCRLGVFGKNEYCLAKMMMDKIKEGLANNISVLNLDEYLGIWKKKLEEEKEKEAKNE